MVKDGNTTSYTYNSNNQLLTETSPDVNITYAYDGSGNLVSKTDANDANNNATYTWDGRNHLLSVSESSGNTVYEYDGDGTRISKTQGQVMTKYINDVALPLVQVLMETTDANVVQAVYNYGNGLISMKRADVNSYYHFDGLGSARQLTNSSGAVTVSYMYDSFGNKIAGTGTSANAYGFTGEQQFNEADNLVFLRARYYKPSIGRFISRDPIGYVDGINLYAYVKNNSVNYADPSGEKGFCGPDGWPGSPIIDWPFAGCCKQHDNCYGGKGGGGCKTSKSQCDNAFCLCMATKCRGTGTCSKAATFCALVKYTKKADEVFKDSRKKAGCPDPPCGSGGK